MCVPDPGLTLSLALAPPEAHFRLLMHVYVLSLGLISQWDASPTGEFLLTTTMLACRSASGLTLPSLINSN